MRKGPVAATCTGSALPLACAPRLGSLATPPPPPPPPRPLFKGGESGPERQSAPTRRVAGREGCLGEGHKKWLPGMWTRRFPALVWEGLVHEPGAEAHKSHKTGRCLKPFFAVGPGRSRSLCELRELPSSESPRIPQRQRLKGSEGEGETLATRDRSPSSAWGHSSRRHLTLQSETRTEPRRGRPVRWRPDKDRSDRSSE